MASQDCIARWIRLMAAFCLLLNSGAVALPFGVKADGRLDMPALRGAYQESEFEKVSEALEAFLKRKAPAPTREERIFAYKHLGVIHAHLGFRHAGDPASQARAESYFNQLVEMSPNIELVDMYAPPNIQELFDRVKRDHLAKQDYRSRYDEFGNPILARPADSTSGTPSKPPRRRQSEAQARASRSWIYWSLGVAAMGAGVGVYIWNSQKDKTRTEEIDVRPGL